MDKTTEGGAEYAKRIFAERMAQGKCPECWGQGSVVVPHYSHSCGVMTDRAVKCLKCRGSGKR